MIAENMNAIQERNRRVEADKAWETSWARRLCIAALTYVVVTLYLHILGVANNYLHALVPVAGYLLSTLTLRRLKTLWLTRFYDKEPQS